MEENTAAIIASGDLELYVSGSLDPQSDSPSASTLSSHSDSSKSLFSSEIISPY